MDSSERIAKLQDEPTSLYADVTRRQLGRPLNVDQNTEWNELELLGAQLENYDAAWRVHGI